jgi:Fe-S cluster assembly ATPase SufC
VYHNSDGEVNMVQVEEIESLSDNRIGGYLMITTLHVEKFRCFKSLDIKGLRRINIIVGPNASGKTVLLEAIKMGLDGTPGVMPFLNGLRSIPTFFMQNPTPEQFQAWFMDLFYDFDLDGKIIVSIGDSSNRNSSVRVYFEPKAAVTAGPAIGFQQVPTNTPPATIVPLAFERSDFEGKKSTLLATINQQGQPFLQPGKSLGIVSGFISSVSFGQPPENAAWLSKLSVQKRSQEVIEAVQRHFPFIQNLTVESFMPGMSAVYADIPYLSRKIPLSLVSSGISRLITLMLAILSFPRGVILIDEIENGIFHNQYAMLWQTVLDLAAHHETQLFISTHSKECLKGAMAAMAASPDSFTLLRVRRGDGQAVVERFGGEQVEAALEKDGEVRD